MTIIQRHNLSEQHTLPIGQVSCFTVCEDAPAPYTCYIRHVGINYLKPVVPEGSSIRFFAEAPGPYELIIIYTENGENCRETLAFTVTAEQESFDGPQSLETYSGNRLLLPNGWDAHNFADFERTVWKEIRALVQPGWTVYDIGANMGIYSTALSRLVGAEGKVYCFEANPMCNYFLQTNLVHENCVENCEILPVAVHNHEGWCDFSINYANTAIGMTAANRMYSGKVGHEIKVHCAPVDALVEKLALRLPDFIKIDIEGAEGVAVEGMQKTLSQYHPSLLIEVHGQQAAQQVFPVLEPLGYTFFELSESRRFEHADEVLGWFPDNVFQFICKAG